MTSHLVRFDCDVIAWLLAEEFGDGSAWCQTCGEFECYRDLGISNADVDAASKTMRSWVKREAVVKRLLSATEGTE